MGKKCYRCGEPATGKEHVPPRVVFPKDQRTNLITVPSCDAHNSEKSQDDEYLAFVLAFHFENKAPALEVSPDKFLRAVSKRPHLVEVILRDLRPIFLGDYETVGFTVDVKRFNDSLGNIVAGLYYHDRKNQLTSPIRVFSPSLRFLDEVNSNRKNKLLDSFRDYVAQRLEDQPFKGENPEIFRYQVFFDKNIENRFAMRLQFYGGLDVVAVGTPSIQDEV